MLVNFFYSLRSAKVPVSVKEFLMLIEAMSKGIAFGSIDDFYLLARTCLIKDEKYYDRFDRAFGAYFNGLEGIEDFLDALIPDDWIRSEFTKHLTEEEKGQN